MSHLHSGGEGRSRQSGDTVTRSEIPARVVGWPAVSWPAVHRPALCRPAVGRIVERHYTSESDLDGEWIFRAGGATVITVEASNQTIDSLVKPLVESAKPESAKREPAKRAEPEASSQMSPLNSLAVKPSRPTRSEPAKPALSAVPPRLTAPALVAAKSARPEFRLKLAGLAPTNDITFQAAQPRLPKAHEQPAEPAPSRRRSVAFVREAVPVAADTSEPALADFVQPGEATAYAAGGRHRRRQ